MTNTPAEIAYKEDAEKMFLVMKKLVDVKTRSLIPPNELPSNQAYGYKLGSNDAFKRVGEMAEAVMKELLINHAEEAKGG